MQPHPSAIQLSLLADCPSALDTVAGWYHDQWGQSTDDGELTRIQQDMSTYLHRHHPPMLILAKHAGQLQGAAQLKIREMDIYPDKEFWIGGVYVHQKSRGQGLASLMVSDLIQRAKRAGIDKLYLQSEQLDGGIYAKLGFTPLEQVHYKGHHVVVMEIDLNT